MGSEAETHRRETYHHGDLRAALLAAAEVELAENGLEKFSLRGCARRAGVSHAAPAHYFKNADALLAALAGLGFDRLTEAMTGRMAAAATPTARLIASGEGYVAFATGNPALFKLMFSSDRPDISAEPMASSAKHSFEVLSENIEAVRAERASLENADAIDIAVAWSCVHGLSHLLIEGVPILPAVLGPSLRNAAIRETIARVVGRSGRNPG